MSVVPRLRLAHVRLAAAVAVVAAFSNSAPLPGTGRPLPVAGVRVRTAAAVPAPAGPCRGSAPADFDGDGASDLAVGAPYADISGRYRAGAVAVRGRAGLTWLSLGAAAGRGDGFGAALAAGDFDRDGCADLAVGVPDRVPGTRRPGAEGEGSVQLFLGSPSGLRMGAALTVRSLGRSAGTDRFGAALAAADLDGDRDDELVVGVPGLRGGGGVAVFGLRGRGLRPGPLITQGTGWVGQRAAETDGFGTVLAAGDFDGDGRAEIAAGAPDDGPRGAGTVTVLDPLERSANYVGQDEPGVGGTSERSDGFGTALAAADFNGDGRDDLAVGAPGEDPAGSADDAEGAVWVLAGPGMRRLGPIIAAQSSRRGRVARYGRFGAALAAGDLGGDGVPDLAVGAPGGGEVRVLRGVRGTGLTARGAVTVTAEPDGEAGPYARFGGALAVGGRLPRPVRGGGAGPGGSEGRGEGRGAALLVGAPGARGFGGAVYSVTVPGGADSGVVARGVPARGRSTAVTPLPVPGRGLTGLSLA